MQLGCCQHEKKKRNVKPNYTLLLVSRKQEEVDSSENIKNPMLLTLLRNNPLMVQINKGAKIVLLLFLQ